MSSFLSISSSHSQVLLAFTTIDLLCQCFRLLKWKHRICVILVLHSFIRYYYCCMCMIHPYRYMQLHFIHFICCLGISVYLHTMIIHSTVEDICVISNLGLLQIGLLSTFLCIYFDEYMYSFQCAMHLAVALLDHRVCIHLALQILSNKFPKHFITIYTSINSA